MRRDEIGFHGGDRPRSDKSIPPKKSLLKKGRSAAREAEGGTPVPDAYVDAIRPYVSRQVWAMIELQRLTGMRPGEVTMMRTCDLDMTGQRWVYTPRRHKTEHH